MADYGRAGTKYARTRQVVHEFMLAKYAAGEIPTDNRFIFYELEHRGNAVVPAENDTRKNRRRSHGWPPGAQDVIDAVTWLRERGEMPWGWITDETRHMTLWSFASTVGEYLTDALGEATIDRWAGKPAPLILTETRGMAGVLSRALDDYVCPVAPTGGQDAGFLRTEVARRIELAGREVLYIGDLDKAGLDIEANAKRVLSDERGLVVADGRKRGKVPGDFTEDLIFWTRLAITTAQTKGVKPIWKVDGRTGKGERAWQAESLGQRRLVRIVRRALDARLPAPLSDVHEREDAQRRAIGDFLDGFRNANGGGE